MRARLLLAFFGITAFAVLAAAVGIYAFRQVGERLDVVNARVPPTMTSLELSRSAERIIAAAPALLAATDRSGATRSRAELEAEVDILKSKLLDVAARSDRPSAARQDRADRHFADRQPRCAGGASSRGGWTRTTGLGHSCAGSSRPMTRRRGCSRRG